MVRAEYAHLKKDEKAIAQRFKDQGYLKGEYIYDLHLEDPNVTFPAWYTKKDIEYWSKLKAKRIDLVVKQKAMIWIIEITPRVSKAAIGGVFAYRDMYKNLFKPNRPIRLGIVSEIDDLSYSKYCKAHGIKVWIV